MEMKKKYVINERHGTDNIRYFPQTEFDTLEEAEEMLYDCFGAGCKGTFTILTYYYANE